MKKLFSTTLLTVVAVFFAITSSISQVKTIQTRNGHISFFSKTTVENIEAHSHEAYSLIDTEKGEVVAMVLVKGFRFEKALMEEHFNENYIESAKFPKAVFKGKFVDLKSVSFSKNGTYKAFVDGDMTMHGVTKKMKIEVTITVNQNKVSAKSTFPAKLADFNIKVPSVVSKQISESVDVTLDLLYEPYTGS